MPGVIVDGQDVDAVAEAMATAVARARAGEGPSLLEMKTYRYSGHSRSDPATYRPAGELDEWLERDPIDILRASGCSARRARRRGRSQRSGASVRGRGRPGRRDRQAGARARQSEMFAHVYAS